MSVVFKYIYDFLSSPLGLPIEWYYEYIILKLVDFIAYKMAFNAVGTMYRLDIIDGKISGSFFHYTLRVAFFLIVWAVLYIIIALAKLILGY